MSPLACSLVALAALFAVSDAKGGGILDPFCSGITVGDTDPKPFSFKLTVSGGDVDIPDRCPRSHALVGQGLHVCNTPNSKPEIHPFGFGRFPFKKVYIDCPPNTSGCSNLELQVTQYCSWILH